MSYKSYKLLDLLVLVAIATIADAIDVFAFNAFSQVYALTVATVIGFIATVRWNAAGLVVAPIAGAGSVAVRMWLGHQPTLGLWLAYTVGYLGLAVVLLFLTKDKKDKILENRWKVVGIYVIGCLAVDAGRALCQIGQGEFWKIAVLYFATDLLNVVFGIIVLLIAHKQPNLVVDMKKYLIRLSRTPESATEHQQQVKENKLSQLTDSYDQANDAALLDGGMLDAEDLHRLDEPLRQAEHRESRFDQENKALEEYHESKKGK